MTSFVWGRHPEEASRNPYEYEAQEQFAREARTVLDGYLELLLEGSNRYRSDDNSSSKACWMLLLDALDSLRDCLSCLIDKRHRIAGRLFRDSMETIDLARYFASSSPGVDAHLEQWFRNEVIPHRIPREAIKRNNGSEAAKAASLRYSQLSKYTHRTYRALLKSYILGRGDTIVYDGAHDSDLLVLPQTIAGYYAVLADQILEFRDAALATGIVSELRTREIWELGLEAHTVPRRFAPNPTDVG